MEREQKAATRSSQALGSKGQSAGNLGVPQTPISNVYPVGTERTGPVKSGTDARAPRYPGTAFEKWLPTCAWAGGDAVGCVPGTEVDGNELSGSGSQKRGACNTKHLSGGRLPGVGTSRTWKVCIDTRWVATLESSASCARPEYRGAA